MSIANSIRGQIPPIHKEGYPFIGIFALASLVLFWIWTPLGWIGTGLTVWCALFFRAPVRVTPTREGVVVSPADGKVSMVQPVLPPAELPLEVWERTVHVNLTGTYYANRAFGTRMARQGRGSIVNIASIAAIGSVPVHAYASSKAGVVSLTQNLAGEWGRAGVRVNCVSPGSTLVPRVVERIRSGRYAADPAEFTALGRIVQPREVAESIEFLASDRASAITGVNLVVDAGWHVAGSWAQYGGVRPAPSAVQAAGGAA